MPVRISLNGLTKLKKDLPKFTEVLEKDIAEKAPAVIVGNIMKNKTGIFPLDSLPQNHYTTAQKKIREGKPVKSMVDDRELIKVSNWQIEKDASGYLIKPPRNRMEAVFHLNNPSDYRPAYKIMDIPKGFTPLWVARLTKRYFDKIIPKYA